MLIRCPECGQQISDQAGACPHCGAPVERTQQPVTNVPTVAKSRRARGIILFSALVLLLLDIVLYVAGRLVVMSLLRKGAFRSGWWWNTIIAERLLIVCAGTVPTLVIGLLLSWGVLRVLHLNGARRSTRWILGCSVSLGTIVTLVSAWLFWANSYLPLGSSIFPELPASWGDSYIATEYMSENWWLVPELSSVFLVCNLIAATVRAVYVKLFEKQ